jgi:hypothetical protein
MSNKMNRQGGIQPDTRIGKAIPRFLKLLLVCVLALLFFAPGARAQTTAFTFQGRLNDSGAPANGSYDLELKLFNTTTVGSGTQIGATIDLPAVPVANGVFTVQLDFTAAAFPGADRFVEVGVKPAGSGNPFSTLTPRQPITPTPYALHSADALTATYATNAANFNIAGTGTIGGTLTAGTSIGVGTTAPLAPLDVRGNVFIGLTADPASPGGNSLFLANDGGDSHNSFRLDAAGNNLYIIGHSNTGAGSDTGIIFRTAAKGTGETDQAKIDAFGNMGIGTNSPQTKLDVRGDIKLGSTGQLFAPGGEENLRVIRGVVGGNGTIINGSGFTVSHSNEGVYYITYNTPFSSAPAVTATSERKPDIGLAGVIVAQLDPNCGCIHANQVKIVLIDTYDYNGRNYDFDFIAIGPR